MGWWLAERRISDLAERRFTPSLFRVTPPWVNPRPRRAFRLWNNPVHGTFMTPRSALFITLLSLIPAAHGGDAPRGQTQELGIPVAGATRWLTVYQPPGYRPRAPAGLLLRRGGGSTREH